MTIPIDYSNFRTFRYGGAAALSSTFLVAAMMMGIAGLFMPPAANAGYDFADLQVGLTLTTTLLVLTPLFLVIGTPAARGYGTALPRRPRTLHFLTAAALAWLAMGATGVANPWLRYAFGQEQWEGFTNGASPITDGQMVFLAINAGLSEEALYLALPTGTIYLLGSAMNLWRKRTDRTPIVASRLWGISAILGPALVIVGRGSGHLYQGTMSAVLGLMWGLALAAVFFWVRSVWPVMLGHAIYDLPVHYGSWAGLIAHHVITPAVIAGLGAALLWRARRRRSLPVDQLTSEHSRA